MLEESSETAWSPHHGDSIAAQYGSNIQNSIVGNIGEDVDGGDDGHGDADGQRKVPGKTNKQVYVGKLLTAASL